MIRNSLAAISVASLATFLPLNAEEKKEGVYLTGSVGISYLSHIDIPDNLGAGKFEFDSAFSGEVGIGYDFGAFRTEVTFNSNNTNFNRIQGVPVDLDVDVTSYFLSAAYDFRSDKKIQPYIGVGIGSSTFDVEEGATVSNAGSNDSAVNLTADDDTTTSFKGKVGLNFEASDDLDVYGEVWGQTFSDFDIGTLEFSDASMAGAAIGVRVKF